MALLCHTVSADPVIWNFEGSTNVASQVPAGISASNASFGSGLNNIQYTTGFSGGLAYEAKGWTNQNSQNADDYIEFCITNNSGSSFTIDQFSFNENRSATGVSMYDIEYSIDMGSSMSIGSGSIPDNTSWRSHNFTLSIDLANGSEICIKIFGYDAENGGSTWKFDNVNINSNVVLPVDISSFNATSNETSSDLSWTTASEINNDYFEVEHSADNYNFESIGYVKGVGNSTINNHYEFRHKYPSSTTNYYRLKQYDLDGQYNYSDIIASKWKQTKNQSFQLYPTVVTDEFSLQFDGNKAKISIHNLNGETLYQSDINNQSTINVYDLPKGTYIFSINIDDQIYVDKFIKS